MVWKLAHGMTFYLVNLKKPSNRNSTRNRNNLTSLIWVFPPQVFPHLWGFQDPLSLPVHLHRHTAGPSGPDCTAAASSRSCCSETQRCFVQVAAWTLWVRCHDTKCNTVFLTHTAWLLSTRSSWCYCPNTNTFFLLSCRSYDFLGNESTRHNHILYCFIKFNIDK